MKWMRFIWVAFFVTMLSAGNVLAQEALETRPGRVYWTYQEDNEGAYEIAVRLDGVSDVFGASFALALRPMANVSIEARAGNFLGDEVLFFQLHDRSNDEIAIGVSRKRPATGVSGGGVLAYVKMLPGLPSEDILEIRDVRIMDSRGRAFTVDTEPVPEPEDSNIQPSVRMSIPDTTGRVGEVLRIPVRVSTSPDVPGVYSGAFGFEIPGNAMAVVDSGFTPAKGVLAFPKIMDNGIVVSFVAMPPAQGVIGYLTVSVADLGAWRCEWGAILKTNLDPAVPPYEIEGKSIITGTAAFDVKVSSSTATMGDAITLTIGGGALPFFVPSESMDPSMLLRSEQRPDARVFALVPNDLFQWPAGKRAITMTVRVYTKTWEVPTTFTLKARIGDANVDHVVNGKDVVAILRLFLADDALLNNYIRVAADADGDERITPNDAAYTLYMVIDIPGPVPLNGTAYKRLAGDMITDDVIANALQFLRDIEGDNSHEAEQARQMLYNLIGRDRLTAVEKTESLPSEFSLGQNYPNPFNAETAIRYDIPKSGDARLTVYNAAGQLAEVLAEGFHTAGSYTAHWNAGNLGNGTYFYVLEAPGFHGTGRMVLIK